MLREGKTEALQRLSVTSRTGPINYAGVCVEPSERPTDISITVGSLKREFGLPVCRTGPPDRMERQCGFARWENPHMVAQTSELEDHRKFLENRAKFPLDELARCPAVGSRGAATGPALLPGRTPRRPSTGSSLTPGRIPSGASRKASPRRMH